MRAVVQRVSSAAVCAGGRECGRIARGLLVFLGVGAGDTETDLDWLVSKIVALRIFEDADGRMNRDVLSIGGGVLLISQFTLFGNVKKGNRPSFNAAGAPEFARDLYERAARRFSERLGATVPTGVFGAHMDIAAQNDGPVTLILDSKRRDF